MSVESDIALQIHLRAALDIDGVWGYPPRMTIVNFELDGYEESAYEDLRAGQNIVFHLNGVEVLMQPRRSLLARLRRRVSVDVRWRPIALDGEASKPEPSRGMHFTANVSRDSLFESPLAAA